jgi:hypothetical protein
MLPPHSAAMSATPADSAAVLLARYGLSRPTEEETLAALTRVLGPERARLLWERACEAAGVEADAPKTLRQLKRMAACMATFEGPAGVMGASLSLRIGTYEAVRAAANEKPK